MVMAVIYYKEIFVPVHKWKLNTELLKQSFPFMLLGFSGLLNAKCDLICVIFYMTKDEIASYQVLMSFIILFQALPLLIFTPYLKNLYRINDSAIHSLQRKSMLTGIVLCSTGIPVIYLILEYFYHLHFNIYTYVFAFVYIVSTFFFFLYIYILFKSEKQNYVMWVSFSAVGLNVIFCLVFIPLMGIAGAMLANCLSQFFMWIIFKRMAMKVFAL